MANSEREISFNSEEIVEKLKDLKFLHNGKYLDRDNAVWKKAAKRIGKTMTSKRLYRCITKNKNGLADLLIGNKLHRVKKKKHDEDHYLLPLIGSCFGIKYERDVITNVEKLRANFTFSGSIRGMSIKPFVVAYWSSAQEKFYDKQLQTLKIESITVDVTGKIVQPMLKTDGSVSSLLLYQALAHIDDKTVPVFQLIAEEQNTNDLANDTIHKLKSWLKEFFAQDLLPQQVISDFALTLLKIKCKVFNRMSLSKYLDVCFQEVAKGKSEVRPYSLCIIRVDSGHLIRSVSRWPSIKKCIMSIRNFYIRCIMWLAETTSLQRFSEKLQTILIVACSEHEDINDPENLCFAAERRLTAKIAKRTECFIENDGTSFLYRFTNEEEDNAHFCDGITNFLAKIKAKSVNITGGNRPNPYYNEEIAKDLMDLCRYFLLWTAIMPKHYDLSPPIEESFGAVTRCSQSEVYFQDLKSTLLRTPGAYTADKVIALQLQSLPLL